MKFSGLHPIEVSGSATPLAAEACKNCAAGTIGGLEVADVGVQHTARNNQPTGRTV